MNKLQHSIAMGDHDRTRALLDGSVQIDGVAPVCMTLSPEETFFHAFRGVEFDISELSFSSYLVKASKGESPYIAVPVFLSRAFRHTSIWVRKDRIKTPVDLKGKRVGVPEFQLTANVWARGGGEEVARGAASVAAGAVRKAFTQAKALALEKLADTSATKVTLPFVEEQLKAARDAMGDDYWAYGVAASRRTLETFVWHHFAQGLSSRLMSVDEIFHPATYESYSI